MTGRILRAYLAAPYAAREQVRGYALDLVNVGVDVTASWLDETGEINAGTTGSAPGLDPAEVARHAATDLDDIERCDVLVLFTAASLGMTPADAASGGRHVETGYALAKGIPVIVVGEPENVFHQLEKGINLKLDSYTKEDAQESLISLITLLDHALGFPRWVQIVDNWMEALGELALRSHAAGVWSA